MAIRHIGFGTQDKNGKQILDYTNNLVFEEEEKNLEDYIEMINAEEPDTAPHKIVRVLVDDGMGE